MIWNHSRYAFWPLPVTRRAACVADSPRRIAWQTGDSAKASVGSCLQHQGERQHKPGDARQRPQSPPHQDAGKHEGPVAVSITLLAVFRPACARSISATRSADACAMPGRLRRPGLASFRQSSAVRRLSFSRPWWQPQLDNSILQHSELSSGLSRIPVWGSERLVRCVCLAVGDCLRDSLLPAQLRLGLQDAGLRKVGEGVPFAVFACQFRHDGFSERIA